MSSFSEFTLPLLVKHICPSTQRLFYFDHFAEDQWISSPKAQQGYTCVYTDAASQNKPWSVPQYDKGLKTKMSKNSLGCESSLSTNLISVNHYNSRLLSISAIHLLTSLLITHWRFSDKVQRILMCFTKIKIYVSRPLDLVLCLRLF